MIPSVTPAPPDPPVPPHPPGPRQLREAPISPLPVPLPRSPLSASSLQATPLVVLIGGTFDPPHLGHVALPMRARDELEQEMEMQGRAWLIYVPAARSPHKGDAPMASDAHRRRMLEIALGDQPRTAIWTDELDRAAADSSAPSYTADTVLRARRWLDSRAGEFIRLRLLIGADQAAAFHKWREPRAIIALAEPAVMLRAPIDSKEVLMERLHASGAWSTPELRQWGERILNVGVMDVAATSVRGELNAPNPDFGALAARMDPRVLEYIRTNGLYSRS